MKSGIWYTVVAALVAVVVATLGVRLAGDDARHGVWVGAGIAYAVQVIGFWLLFVLLFPGQRVLAHGLGMVARIGTVFVVALLALPLLGVPAAPTLFSLVAVLFLTTLCEPVILQIATSKRR